MHPHADLLELDPVTGRRTRLPASIRRALRALDRSKIPYAVVGAVALAVRGLPRMTRDLDVVVSVGNAFAAIEALDRAGYASVTPVDPDEDPEPMYVLERETAGDTTEVDLLIAAGEPEHTIIAQAERATVFGVEAPVASLEHLLLMYLYSNQPKHLGDFARIVTETEVDLREVERWLADVHPEMLPTFRKRVREARQPSPPPPRPRPGARRKRRR
jgi:hypothetical protein